MDALSSPKKAWAIAALVVIVVACSRPTSRRVAVDTALTERRPARAEVIRLSSDVRMVCDSVAAMWLHVPEAKVVASDTTIAPRTDDSPGGEAEACQVVATIDSIADTSRVVETYWHLMHWPELIKWHADGPDGESGIYQRALTRCDVARQWDGGDDEDTTVAVSSFQRETTLCWRHLRPLAATDTGIPVDSSISRPVGAVTGAIVRRPIGKKPPG